MKFAAFCKKAVKKYSSSSLILRILCGIIIGFILAVASIQGLFKIYALISFAVPFFMLGLPIFDVCFAVISRVSHGESPWQCSISSPVSWALWRCCSAPRTASAGCRW